MKKLSVILLTLIVPFSSIADEFGMNLCNHYKEISKMVMTHRQSGTGLENIINVLNSVREYENESPLTKSVLETSNSIAKDAFDLYEVEKSSVRKRYVIEEFSTNVYNYCLTKLN